MVTEARTHSNIVENAKQIIKINLLQIKVLMKNKSMIFMIFFMPSIILCGVALLIPEWDILASAYGLMEILILGIVFANLRFSINKSTIGRNMDLSYIRKWHILIASLLTLFLISFLVFNIELVIEMIFESLHFIFMDTFVFYGEHSAWNMDIVWTSLNYSPIYLFYFQTFILNVAIYSFAGHFFHTQKTFLILVLSYFFLVLTLGGCVSMIWDKWYYFEDKGKGEFISGPKLGTALNGEEFGEDWVLDPNLLALNEPTFQYKNIMSYASFFIPQWFNNQHFFNAFRVGANITNDNVFSSLVIFPADSRVKWMYWSDFDMFWNFTMIAPYIYTLVISFASLITGRILLRK